MIPITESSVSPTDPVSNLKLSKNDSTDISKFSHTPSSIINQFEQDKLQSSQVVIIINDCDEDCINKSKQIMENIKSSKLCTFNESTIDDRHDIDPVCSTPIIQKHLSSTIYQREQQSNLTEDENTVSLINNQKVN